MEKIYGYKESDVLGLAEFIKNRKNKTLTTVFNEYAEKSGKAKGTVRNMYYALCKTCEKNDELKLKYFADTPISVGKIVEFKDCEVRALLRAVLKARQEGKSARSVVMELANGDVKTALRYQNKYRSALKNNPELVKEIAKELNICDFSLTEKKQTPPAVSDYHIAKLKKEIDGLVERLSRSAVKENKKLKERILALETENLRLTKLVYSPKSLTALNRLTHNGKMVN